MWKIGGKLSQNSEMVINLYYCNKFNNLKITIGHFGDFRLKSGSTSPLDGLVAAKKNRYQSLTP